MHRTLPLLLAAAAVLDAAPQAALKVDARIAPYRKAAGISGNLTSVGSDSLNNLMTFWVEAFGRQYPGVRIQVEGKGSGTAPPALISGTSQLGPMSREMKAEEIDAFAKRHGYKPTKVAVAIDSLGVFVHRDNPVKSFTLRELDGIFSKTRKGGGRELRTWDQAGLNGAWAGRPISLYGRNSASGTYGYFKDHALFKGDFKDTVKEQPGSSSVVQSVATDRFAIGYSGIGYRTSNVRAVPVADEGRYNGQAFEATYENCLSGKYPLARYLYIYVNRNPKKPLDPLTREFLAFVLSRQGQEIVIKDGYYPLTAKLQQGEAAKLH